MYKPSITFLELKKDNNLKKIDSPISLKDILKKKLDRNSVRNDSTRSSPIITLKDILKNKIENNDRSDSTRSSPIITLKNIYDANQKSNNISKNNIVNSFNKICNTNIENVENVENVENNKSRDCNVILNERDVNEKSLNEKNVISRVPSKNEDTKSNKSNFSTNKSTPKFKNSPYLIVNRDDIREINIKDECSPKSTKDIVINMEAPVKDNITISPDISPQLEENKENKWYYSYFNKKYLMYFCQLFVIFVVIIFSAVNLTFNSNSALWSSLLSLSLGYIIPSPSINDNIEKKK